MSDWAWLGIVLGIAWVIIIVGVIVGVGVEGVYLRLARRWDEWRKGGRR